jgi:prepilin-type N-terminal cleavage/methylation domain-containing protein
MSKVKCQRLNVSQKGFTLVELLVVIAIMAVLATIMVINLTGQRLKRDVTIAQNQLVSNIRQAQSNTLSARQLSPGQSVLYYLLKFNLASSSQYTIEAIYNGASGPQLQDVQTITLPPNIVIGSTSMATYPITITRNIPTYQTAVQNISGNGCALVAFAAPYAKVLFDNSCNISTPNTCNITSPPNICTDPNANDDYGKVIDFVSNTACTASNNPIGCNVSSDSVMAITLTDTYHTVSKTVSINGITGTISIK